VAVLHAASVIGCWGRAASAASVIVCWYVCRCLVDDVLDAASIMRCGGGGASGAVRRLAAPAARPQHLMTLAACNTATRHVPPALALAP